MKPRFLFVAAALLAAACSPGFETYDLRCEGLAEPLAIDSTEPRFSWKISSGHAMEQSAWQIQAASTREGFDAPDLWDSGRRTSADQVMVPWEGRALSSRMQAWWRVRVWDAAGKASEWSRPQRFGIGILAPDSVRGDFIGAAAGDGRTALLRKVFSLDSTGEALLHVNSLGYHEAWLNGRKVSDAVLSPAVSQLDKRSLIVTYDVTDLLQKGRNELILHAGSGWYRPDTFGARYAGPLVRAELDLDGTMLVCTDASWDGSWGGYRETGTWTPDGFGGETIDPGVDPDWGPVEVVEISGLAASPQACEPTVIVETVPAVSVEPAGEGAWIIDFGKIVNGLLDITLPGQVPGHATTASFSDFQDGSGRLNVGSMDTYVSSGRPQGDRFTNKFNHHVFRYVRLDSLDQAPRLEDIRALRIRTGYDRTATFRSDDEDLNRIHDMIAYTLDNLTWGGYMVDCANIERLGYGGDGNASTQTLQILGNVAPLYVNWLQAWIDAQRADGGLPHTAPNPYKAGGGPYWCSFLVQAPWRTYANYGDPRLLERCYPSMLRWLDYVDAYTVDGLLKEWPTPPYRWWYLGDWAAPEGVDVQDPASVDLVNNCALCQSLLDLEQIALTLGKPADAAEFRRRYEALGRRIQETFYHPETATYASGSQIDLAYPLLVGVVPDTLRDAVAASLKSRTETVYGGHLATGLVGVPVLTEWAVQAGECDWFYGLLKQRGYPGYLYMLDNGATGTWEHWDGERSRLHNCFNGIGSWFYQALGGVIPLAPGYRKVRIEPQVPQGVDQVETSQPTPYGRLAVRREGRRLSVDIPVGITASIYGREYGAGHHEIKMP